jgi:PHD/YefM family antitoxin component YafN of YafNO toxin-antitoxin module
VSQTIDGEAVLDYTVDRRSFYGNQAVHLKKSKDLKERFIVDEQGNRVGVLLGIDEYHHLLEELEELESIRAYDRAKAQADEVIPFEQAVAEIEKKRR